MLYNMAHLDEMQEAEERVQDGQSMELETCVSGVAGGASEGGVPDGMESVDSVESFVLVGRDDIPEGGGRSASQSIMSVIGAAISTSKEDRGHRLGNFWNYPEFNPSEKRLGILPESFYALITSSVTPSCPLRYADLGCNEGELTLEFWGKLVRALEGEGEMDNPLASGKDVKALGVDIDEVLIERARARSLACDLASGSSVFSSPIPSIVFVPGNIADKSFLASQIEHISDRKRLTLISLFSTTMWVHIHLGDTKFFEFLRTVCGHCDFFLVEPQPRKCYKNVNKRLRSMGRPPVDLAGLEKLLQIEENIEACILKCGFKKVDLWGEEGEGVAREERTHWERTLMLFQRVE